MTRRWFAVERKQDDHAIRTDTSQGEAPEVPRYGTSRDAVASKVDRVRTIVEQAQLTSP